MKRSRFTKSPIVAILMKVELSSKLGETCSKDGISEPTYFMWERLFAGMKV